MWPGHEERGLEMALQVAWDQNNRFYWGPEGVGDLAQWCWAGPGGWKQKAEASELDTPPPFSTLTHHSPVRRLGISAGL